MEIPMNDTPKSENEITHVEQMRHWMDIVSNAMGSDEYVYKATEGKPGDPEIKIVFKRKGD